MAQCQICRRSDRAEIEAQIVAEVGLRAIASQYGISKSSIHRHSNRCMEERKAKEPTNAPPGGAQARLRLLYSRTERILERAEKNGDTKTAAALLSQLDGLARRISDHSGSARFGGVCNCPNPVIRIIEDSEPTVKNPINHSAADKDAWLFASLADLVKRTSNVQIAGCAVRLASLMTGKPLPERLELEVSKLEATTDAT